MLRMIVILMQLPLVMRVVVWWRWVEETGSFWFSRILLWVVRCCHHELCCFMWRDRPFWVGWRCQIISVLAGSSLWSILHLLLECTLVRQPLRSATRSNYTCCTLKSFGANTHTSYHTAVFLYFLSGWRWGQMLSCRWMIVIINRLYLLWGNTLWLQPCFCRLSGYHIPPLAGWLCIVTVRQQCLRVWCGWWVWLLISMPTQHLLLLPLQLNQSWGDRGCVLCKIIIGTCCHLGCQFLQREFLHKALHWLSGCGLMYWCPHLLQSHVTVNQLILPRPSCHPPL